MHLGGLVMKLTNVGKLRYIRLGDYIIKSTKNNRDLKYGEEYITGVNNTGVFASREAMLRA